MFSSLLIANRGEIARRIIRTARRLGLRTIAVYSDADRALPFVHEADHSVPIGPGPARESYLVADRIIEAAQATGAEAIHPGYGFLSENADFADAVQKAGLIWVGAPPAAIRTMGMKDAAKRLMRQAGVAVTPGTLGEDQSGAGLRGQAEAIGFPVLIKAVAGGGGKGMRRVDAPAAFEDALASCRREAVASFGDDRVLIEKWITGPRHIEVQIFADLHGNIIHLFERDCSLQRRHQKVVEEAPAPGMDDATRAAICEAAIRAARAVGYVGAGTVEFIADASDGLRADRIWFMEMNTRLQVEHPVTEAITGQDLVEWQLRVAAGETLPIRQHELRIDGWAIEARLYAENPSTGFLPSTGRIDHLRLPAGIRVDSGLETGNVVSPHYDPMIAKLIAHASTRGEAARMLACACSDIEIWPIRTNAAFLARTVSDPDFVAARIDTGLIERATHLVPPADPPRAALEMAARALLPAPGDDPWTALTGLRVNAPPDRDVDVEIDGVVHRVELGPEASAATTAIVADEHVVFLDGQAWAFGSPRAVRSGRGTASDGMVAAPMPGQVIALEIAEGDRVSQGQPLLILEAMKMENRLTAPFDGTVAELRTRLGQQVEEGAILARIEPESA